MSNNIFKGNKILSLILAAFIGMGFSACKDKDPFDSGSGSLSASDSTFVDHAEEIIDAKNALTDEAIKGVNADLKNVTENLNLITATANGVSVSWSSDKESVIGTDGVVRRPAYSDGDALVTLIATLSKGSESNSKKFLVKVLKEEKTFEDEKALKKAALDGLQSEYSEKDWATTVAALVEAGKTAIDEADDEENIENAYQSALDSMKDVDRGIRIFDYAQLPSGLWARGGTVELYQGEEYAFGKSSAKFTLNHTDDYPAYFFTNNTFPTETTFANYFKNLKAVKLSIYNQSDADIYVYFKVGSNANSNETQLAKNAWTEISITENLRDLTSDFHFWFNASALKEQEVTLYVDDVFFAKSEEILPPVNPDDNEELTAYKAEKYAAIDALEEEYGERTWEITVAPEAQTAKAAIAAADTEAGVDEIYQAFLIKTETAEKAVRLYSYKTLPDGIWRRGGELSLYTGTQYAYGGSSVKWTLDSVAEWPAFIFADNLFPTAAEKPELYAGAKALKMSIYNAGDADVEIYFTIGSDSNTNWTRLTKGQWTEITITEKLDEITNKFEFWFNGEGALKGQSLTLYIDDVILVK